MCLIIRGAVDTILEQDALLARAHAANKDGWGVMYARDGRIHVAKGFGLNPLTDALFEVPEGQETFVHLRYATHGKVAEFNNHPFPLVDGRYALMHNGVIASVTCHLSDYSDTWHWARRVESIIEKAPDAFESKSVHGMWEKEIGWSRVCLLRHDGTAVVLNEGDGVEYQGLWLSNDNHTPGKTYSFYRKKGGKGKAKGRAWTRSWGRELVDPWHDDRDDYYGHGAGSYASAKGRETPAWNGDFEVDDDFDLQRSLEREALESQFLDQCDDAFNDPIDGADDEQAELWYEQAEDALLDLWAAFDAETCEWSVWDDEEGAYVASSWTAIPYLERYTVYRGHFGVREALEMLGDEWLSLDEEMDEDPEVVDLDEGEFDELEFVDGLAVEEEGEGDPAAPSLEAVDPDDALLDHLDDAPRYSLYD